MNTSEKFNYQTKSPATEIDDWEIGAYLMDNGYHSMHDWAVSNGVTWQVYTNPWETEHWKIQRIKEAIIKILKDEEQG